MRPDSKSDNANAGIGIPECTGVVRNSKFVQERLSGNDRALGDKRDSVVIVCPVLEEPMPVLP